MNIFDAIFQAIVQGLTEFLPISSDGHLSLVQHFSGIKGEQALIFTIILHIGTLAAICIAFYDLIIKLIFEFFRAVKDIFTLKFSFKNMSAERRMLVMLVISLACFVVYIPTIKMVEGFVGDGDILVEGFSFLTTAAMLFVADRVRKGKKTAKDIKVVDAITIGLFQGTAIMPGISRSGSTISSALIMGLTRETAVEYSFLLGVPSILAGSIFELNKVNFSKLEIGVYPIVIGLIVSAVVGFFAINLLKWLVKTDRFKIFAYYTAILGVLVIIEGIFENIVGKNIFQYLFK